jgi:4-azaleucine resistance transporter AzlC
MPTSSATRPSRARLFWRGAQAILPLMLGVVPFGMIYGVLARQSGIVLPAAQSMSFIVFAGSSQFIAAQLLRQAVPALVIILTIFIVNLRHALYSASIAPFLSHLSPLWKAGLAYFLTDEAYAVAVTHYQQEGSQGFQHYFFLGAGSTLWLCWQISTAVGTGLGTVIPASWSLDFALPLTFIALLIPIIKDRAGLAAALVAGVTALLAYAMPYQLGILTAALAGIAAGMLVESRS